MSDAITILQEDHRTVEQLFERFEQTGDYGVAMQVCEELTIHAAVEEELVYGLYRAKVDSSGADHARQEHQQAKDIIVRIEAMGPEGEGLADAMQELKTTVEHHVQEEESGMFPKLMEALPGTAPLLGNDILERKEQLLAQRQEDKAVGMTPSTSGQKPNQSTAAGWGG
ncbi:MAG: hemerythrin domain-containing protein [Actinomycetota bacterium]|nr:hemerythrin domain-containing protein [Actinomycetota bacterium]